MKVAWLTDVQAPYREPMFRALARLVDLDCSFFVREDTEHRWVWRDDPGYASSVVPARRIPVPERVGRILVDDVCVLRRGVTARVLDGADALVTQVWWQPAHLQAILRCRRYGIPYLIYAESTMEDRHVRAGAADRLRGWVFRNAGAVVVPGPAAARTAIVNGTPADRVIETVNSVDPALYRDGVRARRDPRDADGEHRFAFVGRLVALKNVDSLLHAFAGLPGRPMLEIAGDGVEEQALRALACALGISDRVTFLGYLDEPGVLSLLARTHTLVLPSTKEVYGYVALEAYVAGLQVVVSESAGISHNLAGRERTWVAAPTVEGLRGALLEARRQWSGWIDRSDAWFASPERAAQDLVTALSVASAGGTRACLPTARSTISRLVPSRSR